MLQPHQHCNRNASLLPFGEVPKCGKLLVETRSPGALGETPAATDIGIFYGRFIA